MSHSNSNSGGCLPGIIIFLIICYIIGAVSDSGKHTCYYIGCDREVDKNETYCWSTKITVTVSPIMLQRRQRLNPIIINSPLLHPVILRQLKLLILRMFTTPTMMDMMTYMTIWEITMKIDMMKMTIIGTV